jgi:chromosome segregation protein
VNINSSSQEIEQDIEVKDKLIEQKQEEVQVSRQKQQDLLREKDRLEYQLQTIDERMQKVHAVKKENKVQLQQLQKHKANFKHATIRLNTCLEKDSGFAAQVSHARKKLADFQEKHAQLNAKTMAMQANLAQNAAVGALKKQKGVHGTIAELGQVQKKYSNALETAAGARMQHLVVDSDKTAAACIKLLKEKNLGRASFIPLNKIKFREISAQDKQIKKQDGVHDFALKLISYPAKYQKAFSHVFGNTLIVDDINAARKVGIGRIKMATLDGNSAEVSGVMRGGSQGRRGRMGFKEKGALEELQAVESSIGQQESIINNIYDQRKANEEEISTLRTQRAELEGEIITLEKTLHLNTGDMEASTGLQKELQKQLSDVDQQLSGLQKQVGSLNKDLAGLKSKKQILRSQVSQLRNPRLLAQLSAFEEAKQQCRDQIVQFESDIKTTKVQVEQMFSPELQKMQEIMKQHQKEEQRFSKELQQLSSQVQKRGKDLEEKEKASKIFYSKYKGLFNEREKLTSEVNQAENSIEQLRDKTRGNEREINLVSLKNAEVKAKLAGLQEQYAPYKNVKLLQGKNLPQLQQEVNKFEVILGQMSAVNMKALEVYEQIEWEYNKLVEKKSSLESEKTDVLTLMNEIETGKKTHFMKTFKHANNNFQRIFGGLFKKGKAHLELNNPKNPFEDGVSIKVKLTGRRYLDIKSLSGGEKTLTALSFIFAIQEYQPASFYILDEIDAALDKHNSGRLAELIRSYSGNAQYILISHNDALISEADTLFGISMRDGISKVTSLKI